MATDTAESGAEIDFRLDDLVQQLEAAYQTDDDTGIEVLIGIGTEMTRVGDPFRLRELLDLVIAGQTADARDGMQIALTGAADQPLGVEITGLAELPPEAAPLLARMAGEVLPPRRSLTPKLRLSLPFRAAQQDAAAQPADPAQAPDVSFDGLRLLIADDSPTNLMVIQEMLSDTGANMHAVEDGLQALQAWRAGSSDLLLLDIAMPKMDGLTVLQTIRAEEEAGDLDEVPAVAVTANAMPHQVAEYILGGFDTHLSKPFRRRELIAIIASLCPRDGVAG